MHEEDHDVSWEGRNAFKHEVRREEGAGQGVLAPLLKCRCTIFAWEGMGAEVLESLGEPWLQTAAGGS